MDTFEHADLRDAQTPAAAACVEQPDHNSAWFFDVDSIGRLEALWPAKVRVALSTESAAPRWIVSQPTHHLWWAALRVGSELLTSTALDGDANMYVEADALQFLELTHIWRRPTRR